MNFWVGRSIEHLTVLITPTHYENQYQICIQHRGYRKLHLGGATQRKWAWFGSWLDRIGWEIFECISADNSTYPCQFVETFLICKITDPVTFLSNIYSVGVCGLFQSFYRSWNGWGWEGVPPKHFRQKLLTSIQSNKSVFSIFAQFTMPACHASDKLCELVSTISISPVQKFSAESKN